MFAQQFLFLLFQRPAARIFVAELGESALNADELPARVVVFVEPVGVDRKSVIVGMCQNIVEKGVFNAHARLLGCREPKVKSTRSILATRQSPSERAA